jgi:hypothetical protein
MAIGVTVEFVPNGMLHRDILCYRETVEASRMQVLDVVVSIDTRMVLIAV